MMKELRAKKEARLHGCAEFPLAYYRMENRKEKAEKRLLVKHHWHEEAEMIYLEKGHFRIEVNMERYEADGPAFCFINREELHFLEADGVFWESAVVFLPEMLLFAHDSLMQRKCLLPLVSGGQGLPRFVRHGEPGFEPLLEAYRRIAACFPKEEEPGNKESLAWTDRVFGQMRIKGALLEILSVLGEERLLREERAALDRRVETIKKSIAYMKEHYDEKIYVGDLAGLVNMNEQYFSRFFKNVIGKPPMMYLNELRIRESAVLLRETDKTVTEVCMECGFRNLGNFMRAFREVHGCTPLQYRKKGEPGYGEVKQLSE